MNIEQQKLFTRLKEALDTISGNAETEAEVTGLFEDLVISFEEIVAELGETSDAETAATLKTVIHAASGDHFGAPETAAPIQLRVSRESL